MKIKYSEIKNFIDIENEPDEIEEVKSNQNYFDPLDFTTPLSDRIIPAIYTQSGKGLCEIPETCPAKVYMYANLVEIVTSLNPSQGKGLKNIKKIDAEHYKNLKTGKTYRYEHHRKNLKPMSTSAYNRSVRELERLVLGNFFNANEGLFLTLEYDNIMLDYSATQKDYTKFYDNLKYYFKTHYGIEKLIYIKVVEDDGNGSIHFHILLKAQDGTPLEISEDTLRKLWGQNSVSVKAITKIEQSTPGREYGIKVLDNKGYTSKQRAFYKKGIRMYSASQELKRPTEIVMSQEDAEKKVEGYKMIDKSYSIVRKGVNRNVLNITNYETYVKEERQDNLNEQG